MCTCVCEHVYVCVGMCMCLCVFARMCACCLCAQLHSWVCGNTLSAVRRLLSAGRRRGGACAFIRCRRASSSGVSWTRALGSPRAPPVPSGRLCAACRPGSRSALQTSGCAGSLLHRGPRGGAPAGSRRTPRLHRVTVRVSTAHAGPHCSVRFLLLLAAAKVNSFVRHSEPGQGVAPHRHSAPR